MAFLNFKMFGDTRVKFYLLNPYIQVKKKPHDQMGTSLKLVTVNRMMLV